MKRKPCLPAVCLAVAILVAGCSFSRTPDTPEGPAQNAPSGPAPDAAETPEKPGPPDTPDKPDTPDVPDKPDTPDTLDTPDTPDTPDAGDMPDIPDTVNPADTPGTITPLPEEPGGAAEGPVARPSACGTLRVEGTQLVNSGGSPVQLRGISTHGLAWFPQFVNEACFRELSEWGANAVRLALYTAEYGGWCTGGDREALMRLVTDGVEYAARADMYAIVDWHILSDGDPNTYVREAADFFETVTEKLRDYNNVLYEICNEPNGGASWDGIKAYAEIILPVIRENAPDAVVLVGTPNWSQRVDEAARDPIEGDKNIMYTLHFYAGTHKQDLRDTMTAAISAGIAVFVSEYGICDASGNGALDTAEAQRWVEAMDNAGVSYMLWNLSNKAESSAVISASSDKTSGFEDADLTECGRWFKALLASESAAIAPEPESEPEPQPQPEPQPELGTPVGPEVQPGIEGPSVEVPVISEGEGGISWTLTEVNSWRDPGGRYVQYVLTVKNTGSAQTDTWRAELTLDGPFELQSSWNGVFTASGDTLAVTPAAYNAALAPGAQTSDIGFIVRYAD